MYLLSQLKCSNIFVLKTTIAKTKQRATLRYLQFNDICIDTQMQLLIKSGEQILLAPKVYDLLLFFCLNQHRVISKDELMDNVWSGTIVTENAISRTIVKVRKALGDDPKQPKYIITMPKKGYRMVANFTATEQVNNDADDLIDGLSLPVSLQIPSNNSASDSKAIEYSANTANTFNMINLAKITVFMFMLVAIFYVWHWYVDSTAAIETKQIKPLTRAVEDELNPAVSPDLLMLAYTKQNKGMRAYIIIEDLKTQVKQSIFHPSGKLSKPVWSPTENKLAFLYQHNDVCTIFWAPLSDIKDSDSWQAISECGADSSPQFVFSPNGQHFYFNDRQSNTNGYQVFRVDLSSLQKDIINQPITSGLGNYAFDISPNGERLVLLNSEFAPHTRIYTLGIADSLLTQTAQLPYLMRSVRWGHDNQTIVHPSPHPAYELWQSSLDGNKMSVFASNTSRVKHLSRINNGKDFSFVSYLLNRDIFYQQAYSSTNEYTEHSLDNSSVMDYLPALANNSKQYAFVSKRSTTAEVYLSAININGSNENQVQRLTFFNDPVKLYHLAFSPNDSQLLILADNQLFIANTSNFSVKQLPIKNISINGASWKDEHTIVFSTIKNNNWYAVQYNTIKQEITSLPTDYQGGIFSPRDNSYYLIADNSGKIMKFDQMSNTAQPINLICTPSFRNRKLNLVATAEGLACLSDNNDNVISHYNFTTRQVDTLPSLPTNLDFSANATGYIYTKMTRSVADVMRTSTK